MDDFGTSFDKKEKGGDLLSSGPTFSFENTAPVEGFAEHDFGGDSTTNHSSSTTRHSIGPGHEITPDGRIKAGNLTFNLPGFNSESTSDLVSPVGEALSPTTTREGKSG